MLIKLNKPNYLWNLILIDFMFWYKAMKYQFVRNAYTLELEIDYMEFTKQSQDINHMDVNFKLVLLLFLK